MVIKAAVFDLDGTLTSDVDGKLTDDAIRSCRLLQEKGILVVICSGRACTTMTALEGRIFPDYCIGANGAEIRDRKGNALLLRHTSRAVFESFNRYCAEHCIGLMWKFADTTNVYVADDYLSHISGNVKTIVTGPYHDPEALPLGGDIVMDKKDIGPLEQHFDGQVQFVDGGFRLFDVMMPGMSKGRGLSDLMELLHISRDEVIAFGDSENDISMLMAAGVGVAMGNGYESTKAGADYVTTASSDNGISNALKHYGIL